MSRPSCVHVVGNGRVGRMGSCRTATSQHHLTDMGRLKLHHDTSN